MAIPVKFQQFKSAGIYRIVYDKSTVLGTEAELLRLVVGYSPKGPFNTPVYIKSVSEFKTIFGDVSKSLEKRGCYFHRTCIHALTSGPILCLNLKKFSDGTAPGSKENVMQLTTDPEVGFKTLTRSVPSLYDTTRFWTLEPENLNDINGTFEVDADTASYLNIAAIDSIETSNSVFIRKPANSKVKEYNISVSDWYKSYGEPIPDYLVGYENMLISDFFTEVYVFNGKFTVDQINSSKSLQKYFSNTVYDEGDLYHVYGKEVKVGDVFKHYSDIIMYAEKLTSVADNIKYIGSVSRYSINGSLLNSDTHTYTGPLFKPTELNPIEWVKQASAAGEDPETDATITYYSNRDIKFDSTLNEFVLETDNTVVVIPSRATDDTGIIYNQAQIYKADGEFANNVWSQPTYYSTKSVMYGADDTATITENATYPIWVNAGDPIYGEIIIDGVLKENTPIVLETIKNAFGDELDALDALYNDSASGALAHYVGTILPNFIDNNSGYKSIDILFNVDSDIHHMMMSLDDNLLDGDNALAEYIVEINPVNNEKNFITPVLKNDVANRTPYFLRGYVYDNAKPDSNTIADKLKWQNEILSVLSEEKGLRTALLSPAEIEYRYIVDSFETYWAYNTELKNQLSLLAMEKELCFAICNFPAISTYAKQDTATFTTSNKVISVQKIVNNTLLPSEPNGASFCAFYTPLKFSDGYVDTIVPSAGLVSNLFIDKYNGRAAYSIIAGPNYGAIRYNQLVGPDYHYSQEELHIIEPFGVNCMVYRPTFGTFINANQTAKQTPKSALSSINVRELVIYLQDEIGKILQSYQWEFNNPTTREAIKAKADIICETAKRDGGIQKYLNVMDESNNDADIIDNEMCVLSTSIEPGRGAGKMIHELTIYRTGGMSSMITEE